MTTPTRALLDRTGIEGLIPHRPPFLFLDRVVERDDLELVAEWRVPETADWFRGHYPGNPVTPGVILCEHVMQTAAVLLAVRGVSFAPEDGTPVLARIEKAKFKRMVRPGEVLTTRAALKEQVAEAYFMEGKAAVGGEPALELRFTLTRTKPTL